MAILDHSSLLLSQGSLPPATFYVDHDEIATAKSRGFSEGWQLGYQETIADIERFGFIGASLSYEKLTSAFYRQGSLPPAMIDYGTYGNKKQRKTALARTAYSQACAEGWQEGHKIAIDDCARLGLLSITDDSNAPSSRVSGS